AERAVPPPLGIALLRLSAQLRHPREVDFEEARDVRRDAPRHHHVIGRDLPNLGPRLDAVARPRLDGGVLNGARSRESGAGGGWRRCRSALDVAQNVLLGDTTHVAAARDARDVDAVLGGDLANEWRRLGTEPLLRGLDPTAITASDRGWGLGPRGWGCRCGLRFGLRWRCRRRCGRFRGLGFRGCRRRRALLRLE